MTGAADGRFVDVFASHWPVFGLLAGIFTVIGLIALVRGRRGGAAEVSPAEVPGVTSPFAPTVRTFCWYWAPRICPTQVAVW